MDLFDVDESARISELATLIKKYQDSYYNGEAEISDAEFDRLWDELKSLDPANPVLQKVGADSGNFAKVRHIMPMGSQEKAADPEQFLAWTKNHSYDEYLVEFKLDGASLELQYRNGELIRAVTRGDGTIGDDITANAKKMQGVKLALYDSQNNKINFTGAVRGEVIMTHTVHQKYYSDKANCRNAANGLMKRKDGTGSENLVLMTYDALASEGESPFSDEEEKINWLKSLGFVTSPLKICSSPDAVIEYRASVMEERKSLDYDIDGLVIKERRIDLADASRARPDRQIAFKFSLEEAVSTLREVEWSESGATYTPVAIFDEVQLNGTTVQRASLANPDTMRALGVKIGSKVVVVKRGEIIPKIESVLQEEEGQVTSEIVFPTKCSCCGSELVDEGSRLYCPNKACEKRVLHRLEKWIGVVDIRDFGITLLNELFRNKEIASISDIYKLTSEQLIPYFLNEESIESQKDSLGAKKVYESIQNHRRMSLSVFIAGFDIEGLGETMIQKLVDAGFNSLEKLFAASVEDISSVYGFAEITAQTFVEGLSENKEEMLSLTQNGIILLEQVSEGKLTGKSFCFTGELKTMKRADAEKLVKENGGSCKSSVTKDLSYLVTNDTTSGSSKNKKAAQYGVAIIDEEGFLSLVK
ncbi:MAG: NAD-dependent DNA ligase LigA [Treponema sp.]|nr:NAD-dependent DNA ligase LigA [Candidatus Treponema equifaecale]